MTAGHILVCVGVVIAVAEVVTHYVRKRSVVLRVNSFITTLSNGITLATGALLVKLSLLSPDDGVLNIGENRLGLVIGGFAMLIYAINQLATAFRSGPVRPAVEHHEDE